MEADQLKKLVNKRTGLKPKEIECPREKSFMTPCSVRDGDIAMSDGKKCEGCGVCVLTLLWWEKKKLNQL